jgi:hypothetical protein
MEKVFQREFWKYLQDPKPSTKTLNFDGVYRHNLPSRHIKKNKRDEINIRCFEWIEGEEILCV